MSVIARNRFALTASFSEGDAITSTGSGCMIYDNYVMYLVEDTWTNNPFLENGSNHWGLNYRQGVSIMPVTA